MNVSRCTFRCLMAFVGGWALVVVTILEQPVVAEPQGVATFTFENNTSATIHVTVQYERDGSGGNILNEVRVPPNASITRRRFLPRGILVVTASAPYVRPEVAPVREHYVVSGPNPKHRTFSVFPDAWGLSAMFDVPSKSGGTGITGVASVDDPRYMGCYEENRQADVSGLDRRVLGVSMIKNHPQMTIEMCIAKCAGDGQAYAGLQYSRWCFCGSNPGKKAEKGCDMRCSGNREQICGGAWRNSVYRTR